MSTETKPPITPAYIRALAGYYQRRADFKGTVAEPDNATPEAFATVALALRLLASMRVTVETENYNTNYAYSCAKAAESKPFGPYAIKAIFKEAIRLVTPDDAEGI
jgi:hypothetical protein